MFLYRLCAKRALRISELTDKEASQKHQNIIGNIHAFFFCLSFLCISNKFCYNEVAVARSKTQKFFSDILKSEFSILAIGQNRKLGNKKTRNIISEISEISEVSEISICHFFIIQNVLFFFQYSTVGNSVLSIYVMFCFQSLLKWFFLNQNYMLKPQTTKHKPHHKVNVFYFGSFYS